MELPSSLRSAVDAALEHRSISDLAQAASILSARYRAELCDGNYHLADDLAALAYLATRLPATYAAVYAALDMVRQSRPDFSPLKLLDVGAGPGTTLWAVINHWSSCTDALMIEGSQSIRAWGERFSQRLSVKTAWEAGNILSNSTYPHPLETPSRDLVTLCYVLDEIPSSQRPELIERLWSATADTLVIIEPGTPAGYERIIKARDQLLTKGAHIVAPCAHAQSCPIKSPDWCHFSRRVARSRIHRLAKGAEVPWEDEKYTFVAVSRYAASVPFSARVLSPPKSNSGRVSLTLCRPDGTAGTECFSRRDGDTYRHARRISWGDRL